YAKLDRWTWGSAPVRAFEGEVEITLVGENRLLGKTTEYPSRKIRQNDQLEVVRKSDRVQLSITGVKLSAELVLLSPTQLSFELKAGGALSLICRGPALFQ